jgi:hypothetical protein
MHIILLDEVKVRTCSCGKCQTEVGTRDRQGPSYAKAPEPPSCPPPAPCFAAGRSHPHTTSFSIPILHLLFSASVILHLLTSDTFGCCIFHRRRVISVCSFHISQNSRSFTSFRNRITLFTFTSCTSTARKHDTTQTLQYTPISRTKIQPTRWRRYHNSSHTYTTSSSQYRNTVITTSVA